MSISVGGLISGLDTNDMIDQMLKIQQQPIETLKLQNSAYEVDLSTYGSLQSSLSTLSAAMDGLNSEAALTSFSATSGDTDLFTVSAEDNAKTGNYSISVTQMAEAQKLTSPAFTQDESVGEGTLHLQIGEGNVTNISVAATDSLEDVAQSINAADAGVQAAVLFDGTSYFLTLAAEDTGSENTISLTATDTGDDDDSDTNGLSRLVYDADGTTNMVNTQDAADAIITVDGVANIHRQTNEIDDVIQGITINLKSAPESPDNTTFLKVERNRANVVSSINAFVNAYNDVMTFIDEQQAFDASTEIGGVLQGDATTNSIRNRLKDMISGTVSGAGTYEKLADMGIELNGDGDLEVDSSALNNALDENFDDVISFFTQSAGTQGFAVNMSASLDSFLDTTSGSLATRTSGIQKTMDNNEDKMENLDRQNMIWETRIRSQYNAMELLLAQYQTTGDYLTQQITGMQNLNSYISK